MKWLGRRCVIFQITHSLPTLTITTIVKEHFRAGNNSVQPRVDQSGLEIHHDRDCNGKMHRSMAPPFCLFIYFKYQYQYCHSNERECLS